MANSPVITSLPKYVEENRLPLISKAVLGAKTPSLLTLQTGVTGATALNLLQTSVVFGDGADCGWRSGLSCVGGNSGKAAVSEVQRLYPAGAGGDAGPDLVRLAADLRS